MLFVTANPGLLITGVRQEKENYNEHTGKYVDTTPGIDVEFRHGGAPEWAAQIALANERFRQLWGGLPDGVDYRLFIGSFDTVKEQQQRGWDDETRGEVEEFLKRSPLFGFNFIHVESPEEAESPPWPTYDKTHHFKVAIVAEDSGVDLAYTLEWEKTHKNRPAVVAALEEKIAAGSPELVEA